MYGVSCIRACRLFCKSAILHAINTHVNAEIPMQDFSERKIEGSPVLWTCEIQGAQHMICMKKTYFLVNREQKLGTTGHWALLEHSPAHGLLCR